MPASRHGAPPEIRAVSPRSAAPSRKQDRRVRRTRDALGQAYAAAMFGLLFWWLNHGVRPGPLHMDELFHRMVWSGIGVPRGSRHAGAPPR